MRRHRPSATRPLRLVHVSLKRRVGAITGRFQAGSMQVAMTRNSLANPKPFVSCICSNGYEPRGIDFQRFRAICFTLVRRSFSPTSPSLSRDARLQTMISRVEEMMHFDPFTTGFAPGLPYGLGLMKSKFPTRNGHGEPMIGHAGQDYGSGAPIAHFFPNWNVSVAITTNTLIGMNCSLSPRHPAGFSLNVIAHELVACKVLDAVLQNVSNGKASKLICDLSPPASLHLPSRESLPQHFQIPGKLKAKIPIVNTFSRSSGSMVCRPYCGMCDKLPCRACKMCVGRPGNPLCAACYKPLPKTKFACLYEDGHGCEQCWGNSTDSQAASDIVVI
eukprot:TRINITY_DN2565_c0_g1_i2.p1 TRINITY_DN2565_c0_g1~~TRINITY_DN2565_c0_g1_i2.p1  ORF type:complete len:332 (-),score=-5.27 TRINITY_DN2565_c0_g1_i2:455-1450(-)